MSDARLKKLQEAWKEMEKIEESTVGYGHKDKAGGIKPVKGYGDKQVKGAQESRPEGASGGKNVTGPVKDGKHGTKGSVNDTVKPVAREEGVKDGLAKAAHGGGKHGEKAAVEGAKPVAREEGAAAGKSEVGEYGDHESFRKRVRAALGLDLDNPLNKGFDKDGKIPADKSSKR